MSNDIHLRKVIREIYVPPSWSEFTSAIMDFTNKKAPGLNGIPPNAFKSTNKENLQHHFDFITEFWEERIDFEEWHKGQVVPVPKNGDLSDPKKWRGFNLMDIVAKVSSSLICKILFKMMR